MSVNARDTQAAVNEVAVLKTSSVYTGDFDISQTKTVLEEDLDRVACSVAADRLIVSRMNTPALVGMAGYSAISVPNVFLPDRLWQVRFTGIDARFVHRWTQTNAYRDQVSVVTAGTSSSMHNLSQADFKSFVMAVPPAEEQDAILRFLDRETAQIDLLIEKQERLIETLAERRQVMIAEVITSAAMQPGGPGGEPRIERLDRVTSDVVDCLHTTAEEDPDGEYIVARTSSVREGLFRPQGTFRVSRDTYEERIAKSKPQAGDILLTREAPSGEACLVPGGQPICLGQRMVLVRPREDKLHPQLVVWNMYMPQARRYLDVETSGSGVQNLTMPRIRRLPLVVPPLARQNKLVAELSATTARVDALSAKAHEMIDVLRERRQALISAAVMGKIDVRGLS